MIVKEKWGIFIETLKNELEYTNTVKYKVINALIWGLEVFAVLFVLRPFGISDDTFFFTCFGYGVITFSIFLINNFFSKSLLFNALNNKWYIWHEILYILIVFPQISIINYLFNLVIDRTESFNFFGLLKISFYTFDIIIVLSILNIVVDLVRSYRKESLILKIKNEYFIEINKLKNFVNNTNDEIILKFENEHVNLKRDSIVFINAWGNYIKINIDVNDEIIQIVKRGKFKVIEEELNKYEEFYKCHRSYMLNIKFLKKIVGTNKKPEAILFNDLRIPISRENIKIIRDTFEKIQEKKLIFTIS